MRGFKPKSLYENDYRNCRIFIYIMGLSNIIPEHNIILGVAERVKQQYPSPRGRCELMSNALVVHLRQYNVNSRRVTGIFRLDEPDAGKYMYVNSGKEFDEYEVDHDWVEVEGKILDISADQFRPSVHEEIPNIVFINHSDPLYLRYQYLKNSP